MAPEGERDSGEPLESLRDGVELVALRALGDLEEAREAAQETLARAFGAVSAGRVPAGVPLAAFVHGIARHVVADVLRRRVREQGNPANDPPTTADPSPLERLISTEERERVRGALRRLPRRDRELLRRCFMAGERVADIAAELGEPAERVRKRKWRALEQLRRLLGDG